MAPPQPPGFFLGRGRFGLGRAGGREGRWGRADEPPGRGRTVGRGAGRAEGRPAEGRLGAGGRTTRTRPPGRADGRLVEGRAPREGVTAREGRAVRSREVEGRVAEGLASGRAGEAGRRWRVGRASEGRAPGEVLPGVTARVPRSAPARGTAVAPERGWAERIGAPPALGRRGAGRTCAWPWVGAADVEGRAWSEGTTRRRGGAIRARSGWAAEGSRYCTERRWAGWRVRISGDQASPAARSLKAKRARACRGPVYTTRVGPYR